jgi:threonine/homoserine efflux transporter RhtA
VSAILSPYHPAGYRLSHCLCWYHVLGRCPASQAGPHLLLLPLFSILGGWLFLGEPVTQRMLVAVRLLSLVWRNKIGKNTKAKLAGKQI